MNIKRYKVEELNCCFDADMIESPNGEYVEYADYAALLAKTDRLDLEVQRLTTALRTCDRILKPLRDKAQRDNESK